MPNLAELRAARERAGATLIQLRTEAQAEGFTETPEFNQRWDRAEAAYDSALAAESAESQNAERVRARNEIADRIVRDAERAGGDARARLRPDYNPREDPRSRGGRAAADMQDYTLALHAWAASRRPDFDPTDAQRDALARTRTNLHSEEFYLPSSVAHVRMISEIQEIFVESNPRSARRGVRRALAALNTMTPESGGYVTNPPQIIQQLEVNRLAWGGLLQVATIRTTTTGEELHLPFTDDTTTKGRRIAEDGPLGTEKNFKVGLMKWGAYKYTSDVIAVTFEMQRDTFVGLDELIGTTGGERLGRIQNYEMTHGVGASMPRGIVFSAPVKVTAASQTAITYDELIDLEESLDAAYDSGERVGWMMHKGTRKNLRKLKDLNGLPLLQLGQETGNRDQLNGKPIFLNMDMDTPAAGKDPILYGDFSKYWIRRVGGSRIVRDPYTKRISNDQELFAVVEYADGNLVNAGTPPVVKLRMAP